MAIQKGLPLGGEEWYRMKRRPKIGRPCVFCGRLPFGSRLDEGWWRKPLRSGHKSVLACPDCARARKIAPSLERQLERRRKEVQASIRGK